MEGRLAPTQPRRPTWALIVVRALLVSAVGLTLLGVAVFLALESSPYDDCGTASMSAKVDVQFVDKALDAGPVRGLAGTGDVVVAFDARAVSTVLMPLDHGRLGEGVLLAPGRPVAISTEPAHLVIDRGAGTGLEVVRLADLRVVARLSNARVIFTRADELIAFGATKGCGPGEARRIDLARSTSDVAPTDFTGSAQPLAVHDGRVVVCVEASTGGSGPSCSSTVLWDPWTGHTAPSPPRPYQRPFAATPGGSVLYWPRDDVTVGAIRPLRIGAATGPSGTDPVGMSPLDTPMHLFPIEEGRAVVAAKAAGHRSWNVCRLPDLTCSEIAPEDATNRYALVGVVPGSVVASR